MYTDVRIDQDVCHIIQCIYRLVYELISMYPAFSMPTKYLNLL